MQQIYPGGEKALFERVNTSDTEAMLVRLVEERIAGNCQITWNNRIKTRHRASVAIALLIDYWNQGIGTRLFQELIRIAENNENILQIKKEKLQSMQGSELSYYNTVRSAC